MIFFGGLERCRQTQINFSENTHAPLKKKRQKKRFGLLLSDCLKKNVRNKFVWKRNNQYLCIFFQTIENNQYVIVLIPIPFGYER